MAPGSKKQSGQLLTNLMKIHSMCIKDQQRRSRNPRRIVQVAVALLASMVAVEASCGENTKPVSLKCEPALTSGVSKFDVAANGYTLMQRGWRNKHMDMEQQAAFGEFDALLTSSYGLRHPLVTLANPRASKQMAETAQLVVSGYVVAAQMMHGVMRKEGLVPSETLRISGNMIFTALEPDGEDPALGAIDRLVRQADKDLSRLAPERRAFARWIVRGYAYNDPVAVDAALVGYCLAGPTSGETKALTNIAKQVRLDPKTIKVMK